MVRHPVLTLAKQGDPRAIAYLITRSLKPHGITARANRKGSHLKLLLEGRQVPHQTTMVQLVQQGMQRLSIPDIQTIELYGRQQGQARSAWQQQIKLLSLPDQSIPASSSAAPTASTVPSQPVPLAESAEIAEIAEIAEVETGQETADELQDSPDSEPAIFQLDDLDPDAMIFVPVDFAAEPSFESAETMTWEDSLEQQVADAGSAQPADRSSEFSDLVPSPVGENPALIADAAALPANSEVAAALTASDLDDQSIERLRAIRLPRRSTGLLLIALWIWCIFNTLTFAYSLLRAGSFSLYTGLDLSTTNQTFASLLSVVVRLADFAFTPIDRWIWLVHGLVFLLSLVWIDHLHRSLAQLFGRYPISPRQSVLRFVVPLYQVWGIGNVLLTLASRFSQPGNLKAAGRSIRRLTFWLYLFIGILIGLMGTWTWMLFYTSLVPSLWFYAARDGLIWASSILWLRLVRTVWRSLRALYQRWVMPILPQPPVKSASRSVLSISAILLGAGTSLLSLAIFNFILGLLIVTVFTSNGLSPEAILPTFYDSESLLTLVLIGSFLCISIGGFCTAALAPRAGLLHALGLGVMLVLIGLAIQQLPGLELSQLPFWFQTASIALLIPATLLGGGLRQWYEAL